VTLRAKPEVPGGAGHQDEVMAKEERSAEDIAAFLTAHHGEAVTHVECLQGGYWSSAYSYRAGARDLVVRFGQHRDGYEMDQVAAGWAGPDLPIPEVLAVGDAFGGAFAISARHHGRFLEDVGRDDAPSAGAALERLLAAFRAVPAPPDAPSAWHPPGEDPSTSTWRRWLVDSLVDDPRRTVSGWRSTLAADPELDALYRRCEQRIGTLLDSCPERRDLVHSDLLHQNVLLSDDWSRVMAVFSWKCSVRGDFLFDVAWCTFWSAWHPGIAAVDLWDRTTRDPSLAGLLDAAPERHHCYELVVGANHLGWHVWTGDNDELLRVAQHTEAILERGPRSPDPRLRRSAG
jgi:aminoglycoside phosphotransferase (APT) family kinase protein